jgi:hypothetical protein
VALLDRNLTPEEKFADQLHDETQILIVAGSEALSRVLIVVAFHLLHNKIKLRKLRDEMLFE